MDRALFGDKPLVVFKKVNFSWFLTMSFTFFRSIAQSCLLVCNWDNPLANVPYVIGNPLANF
jgi:hypothetical protein